VIQDALRTYLLADTTLSSRVGGRLYPNERAPQGSVYPQITYHRVARGHGHHLTGANGLKSPLFQFDIFTERYTEAQDVVNALVARIDGKRETMTGVEVLGCFVQDDFDTVEQPDIGDETTLHWVPVTVLVWHR